MADEGRRVGVGLNGQRWEEVCHCVQAAGLIMSRIAGHVVPQAAPGGTGVSYHLPKTESELAPVTDRPRQMPRRANRPPHLCNDMPRTDKRTRLFAAFRAFFNLKTEDMGYRTSQAQRTGSCSKLPLLTSTLPSRSCGTFGGWAGEDSLQHLLYPFSL